MTRPELPPPELHRPLPLDRIGPAGLEQVVTADAAECAALARRLGVPAVGALSCRYRLTSGPAGVVFAEAHMQALIRRVCVLSLEEFDAAVDERFRLRFVPSGSESDDIDPESDDEIPYEAATIDLGEATAEQLALTLDSYPRQPGAELPEGATAAPESAFAALARRFPRN
jgi:hypothetical protein